MMTQKQIIRKSWPPDRIDADFTVAWILIQLKTMTLQQIHPEKSWQPNLDNLIWHTKQSVPPLIKKTASSESPTRSQTPLFCYRV